MDYESRRITTVDAFNVANKKIKKLTVKLNEADWDKKCIKAALKRAKS